jgi:hypothetical protein
MGPFKRFPVFRELGASKDFDRCHTGFLTWEMVPNMDGMLESKRPQIEISFVWPMDDGVNEPSSGPGHAGADSPFGNTILMLRADSRKREGLVMECTVSFLVISSKDSIVSVIGFNLYAGISCPLFK